MSTNSGSPPGSAASASQPTDTAAAQQEAKAEAKAKREQELKEERIRQVEFLKQQTLDNVVLTPDEGQLVTVSSRKQGEQTRLVSIGGLSIVKIANSCLVAFIMKNKLVSENVRGWSKTRLCNAIVQAKLPNEVLRGMFGADSDEESNVVATASSYSSQSFSTRAKKTNKKKGPDVIVEDGSPFALAFFLAMQRSRDVVKLKDRQVQVLEKDAKRRDEESQRSKESHTSRMAADMNDQPLKYFARLQELRAAEVPETDAEFIFINKKLSELQEMESQYTKQLKDIMMQPAAASKPPARRSRKRPAPAERFDIE